MITIFQHGPGEGPGAIIPYLTGAGIPFQVMRLYETGQVPAIAPADSVIILGGLMSVNDEKEYPFLPEEKKLVRDCAAGNIPVLGICLGAQMIADAYGSAVTKSREEEKGWYQVRSESGGLPGHPERYPVFEWHNETFDLPQGAILLAAGSPVRNQAFRLGSCIGVQYHMEATPEIIGSWAKELPGEAREAIVADTGRYIEGNYHRCAQLLDCITGRGEKA